ncbi:hypothetical protein DMENIID0001_000010 [Sergentomyia squamirostris]
MKRTRTCNTIEEKIGAVKLLHSGEPILSVAEKYKVDRSTVCKWKHQYDDLKSLCQANSGKKKKLHYEKHPKTYEAVSLWVFSMREKGLPVNRALLQEKGREFYEEFRDGPDFSASSGCCTMQPRPGLNYRKLPNKTLVEKARKSVPGFKVNKERVSVLACANATGTHKMPLFVIGKAAKPRAFRNVDKSNLPVKYDSQIASWMTKGLFRDKSFEPFLRNLIFKFSKWRQDT